MHSRSKVICVQTRYSIFALKPLSWKESPFLTWNEDLFWKFLKGFPPEKSIIALERNGLFTPGKKLKSNRTFGKRPSHYYCHCRVSFQACSGFYEAGSSFLNLLFDVILEFLNLFILSSSSASVAFLGESQPHNRKALAVYPIGLFYFVISWLVISHTGWRV